MVAFDGWAPFCIRGMTSQALINLLLSFLIWLLKSRVLTGLIIT